MQSQKIHNDYKKIEKIITQESPLVSVKKNILMDAFTSKWLHNRQANLINSQEDQTENFQLKQSFHSLANSQDFLTVDRLIYIIREQNLQISRDFIKQIFNFADQDKDKKLDFKEFKYLCSSEEVSMMYDNYVSQLNTQDDFKKKENHEKHYQYKPVSFTDLIVYVAFQQNRSVIKSFIKENKPNSNILEKYDGINLLFGLIDKNSSNTIRSPSEKRLIEKLTEFNQKNIQAKQQYSMSTRRDGPRQAASSSDLGPLIINQKTPKMIYEKEEQEIGKELSKLINDARISGKQKAHLDFMKRPLNQQTLNTVQSIEQEYTPRFELPKLCMTKNTQSSQSRSKLYQDQQLSVLQCKISSGKQSEWKKLLKNNIYQRNNYEGQKQTKNVRLSNVHMYNEFISPSNNEARQKLQSIIKNENSIHDNSINKFKQQKELVITYNF